MAVSVKPGSYPFQVLCLLVDYDGELNAEEAARMLHPPLRRTEPYRSAEELVAFAAAREAFTKEHAAKVSRTFGRLQEARLIEGRQPPRLSSWFVASCARFGMTEAIRRANPLWPGKVGTMAGHARMAFMVEKGLDSVDGLLGASPSGATKQVYRELCEWGVLIPPTRRSPTAAGRALVESSRRL